MKQALKDIFKSKLKKLKENNMTKKKKVQTDTGYMMAEKGEHKMPNKMMMKDKEMTAMMKKKKMMK